MNFKISAGLMSWGAAWRFRSKHIHVPDILDANGCSGISDYCIGFSCGVGVAGNPHSINFH
jgi:hypothetical protein